MPPASPFLDAVRPTTRRLARTALVVGALGAVGVLAFGGAARLALRGPPRLDAASLASLGAPSRLRPRWGAVTGERIRRIGRQSARSRNSGRSRDVAVYSALTVGDRVLVVRSDAETPYSQLAFAGRLAPIPDDVRRAFVDSLVIGDPTLSDRIAPALLDATAWRWPGLLALAASAAMLLWAVGACALALAWRAEPMWHPSVRRLARYGSPREVVAALDADFTRGDGLRRSGALTVLDAHLVHARPYRVDVVRLYDVVWFYGRITERRMHGVHTGTTHEAVVRDAFGVTLTAGLNELDVRSVLALVQRRAPWALAGHAPEHVAAMARGHVADTVRAILVRRDAMRGSARGAS